MWNVARIRGQFIRQGPPIQRRSSSAPPFRDIICHCLPQSLVVAAHDTVSKSIIRADQIVAVVPAMVSPADAKRLIIAGTAVHNVIASVAFNPVITSPIDNVGSLIPLMLSLPANVDVIVRQSALEAHPPSVPRSSLAPFPVGGAVVAKTRRPSSTPQEETKTATCAPNIVVRRQRVPPMVSDCQPP
jgi:hypothetical protein